MEKTGKLIVLAALAAGLLALAYWVLSPFIAPMSWAIILAYTTWPLYERLTRLTRGNRTSGALAMVFVLLTAIIVPCVWLSLLLQNELGEVYRSAGEWLSHKPALPAFAGKLPLLGDSAQRLLDQLTDPATLQARILPWLKSFSGRFLQFLGDVGYNAAQLSITLLSVFFIYRDGRQIVREVSWALHQVMGERSAAYIATAGSTVKAVVYGLVLTAIAQGAVAGVGYGLVGLSSPVLLSLITMLFAMIPFGTPLVWISAGLWLLLQGQQLAGIELLVWGATLVSTVDNFVRPLVICSNSRIPFLLVFFGVLGGLAAFGFLGLFLGPVILAVVLAIWREWLDQRPVPDA
ncbi:MAG: AI-2E family transporter [Methylococcaceae bacterium]|nr:MAG: AI-2E family transporter [Methylococcaceae bacterium]